MKEIKVKKTVQRKGRRAFGLFLALLVLLSMLSPTVVYAAEAQKTDSSGNIVVSAPTIGDLKPYEKNVPFDQSATVSTAEGVKWNIPERMSRPAAPDMRSTMAILLMCFIA